MKTRTAACGVAAWRIAARRLATRGLAAWALAAWALAAGIGLAHAQASDPASPIKALNEALATAMKNGGQSFASRYNALAPAVDRAFNLPQILHTVVGLPWSGFPPDAQKKALAAFRAYTIAQYASNFDSDSGDRIELLPETHSLGDDRVVETQIVPKTGEPTRIDYIMRRSSKDGAGGAWQAVDVLEQGTISQAAVQRSDFRNLVKAGPDKLIASLQQNVDSKSGGTIKP